MRCPPATLKKIIRGTRIVDFSPHLLTIFSMLPYELPPDLRARFERALRQPVTLVESIHRGYTPALRLRVHLRDGSTVFIKCATTDLTAGWLRREYTVYAALDAPFMPRMLAWDPGDQADDSCPFLVLEDLSGAHWPPPWSARRIEQVVQVLASLAQYSVPGLEPIEAESLVSRGWPEVARDPQPFLALRFATRAWLDQALPALLAASRPEALQGDSLLHTDVRSDNICFVGERVVLVDWNWTCLGNPIFDLAAWLPSLEAEGGPPPETFLPHEPEPAAVISGYFAGQAGLPIIPDAPRVREVQLQQLRSALPWAVRALGLPPLDGRDGSFL
jgi:hypothetical protein